MEHSASNKWSITGKRQPLHNGNEDRTDYSSRTWLSLVGLLHPSEFFFTVDHSDLWNKHVTWSKNTGDDLRAYSTQRLSSNMVFLSLILSADIDVLFNSSVFGVNMRDSLKAGDYANLDYWIGFLIILCACVTVIGLVANFTVWGMLSSISEANTRALLRSNIGQYVTSLPSRFVVSSLYLFLLWLVLFVVDFLSGPLIVVLVGSVACLFFQVVVSLSAFGRLIIHTGAMGERPVLDPEFEKSLLPSGLHASLLIKATAKKRRNDGAMSMYKRRHHDGTPLRHTEDSKAFSEGFALNKMGKVDYGSKEDETNTTTPDQSSSNDDIIASTSDNTSRTMETAPTDLMWLDPSSSKDRATTLREQSMHSKPANKKRRKPAFSHHRVLTNTDSFSFPLPEILNGNRGGTRELNKLLEMTLKEDVESEEESENEIERNSLNQAGQKTRNTPKPLLQASEGGDTRLSDHDPSKKQGDDDSFKYLEITYHKTPKHHESEMSAENHKLVLPTSMEQNLNDGDDYDDDDDDNERVDFLSVFRRHDCNPLENLLGLGLKSSFCNNQETVTDEALTITAQLGNSKERLTSIRQEWNQEAEIRDFYTATPFVEQFDASHSV